MSFTVGISKNSKTCHALIGSSSTWDRCHMRFLFGLRVNQYSSSTRTFTNSTPLFRGKMRMADRGFHAATKFSHALSKSAFKAEFHRSCPSATLSGEGHFSFGSKPECLPNARMSALVSYGQTTPCALFCHVHHNRTYARKAPRMCTSGSDAPAELVLRRAFTCAQWRYSKSC